MFKIYIDLLIPLHCMKENYHVPVQNFPLHSGILLYYLNGSSNIYYIYISDMFVYNASLILTQCHERN